MLPGDGVRVFVLTGAGVSAESGLGTFRDTGGIWARFDPMQLATPEAFARDPNAVHAFYNLRRRNLLAAAPNAAHAALAALARAPERGGCSSAPRTSTTCTSGRARRRSTTCTASS